MWVFLQIADADETSHLSYSHISNRTFSDLFFPMF